MMNTKDGKLQLSSQKIDGFTKKQINQKSCHCLLAKFSFFIDNLDGSYQLSAKGYQDCQTL